GAAHDLRPHPRRHGRRRGWTDPSAGRAPGVDARHSRADHAAPRRRQRGRRGLPLRDAPPPPPGSAGAVAAAAADAGSDEVRAGERRGARRLRARRRPGGQAGGDPHRVGERGQPRRRRPRGARRRGDPFARGVDAVVGDLRRSAAGVPGRGAAAGRDGARRGGAGVDAGMGTLRGDVGSGHRHAHVRRVGAAQGAAAEVRLPARPGRRRGARAAGEEMTAAVEPGGSAPLGATPSRDGVHFSLYSRHATGVELCFFDRVDDARPSRAIRLDAAPNRTYYYWHTFVAGARPGQIYGYRVDGPFEPERGMRFDATKLLLDPYARSVAVPPTYDREAARGRGDSAATAMKCVVVDPSAYDWEGDCPLRRPPERTIVYEMHVRGFTRHPSSGVPEATRGTFRGLIDKIPYLKGLGITAVELLPVFQFDAQDCPPGLVNYWGYSPVSFSAPHQAYSSRGDPLGPIDEFRDMVKALHRARIEIILDVVFNHTAEGDHRGPTLSFRGIDNATYYILEPDRSRYANYS